jgi:hypothetical protein
MAPFFLIASTLELNGNTIGGSLFCQGGTVILRRESPDPSSNAVRGRDTWEEATQCLSPSR